MCGCASLCFPQSQKTACLPFLFPLNHPSQTLNRGAFFCPGVRR
ncbi:pyrBI operon leader peptide [Escherichia coli]|nr:pyrBI operon leader peptide [Escherichia coli]